MDELIKKILINLDNIEDCKDVNYICGYIQATMDAVKIVKGEDIDGE